MGSTNSTSKSVQSDNNGSTKDRSSKVLFFLHRTWAVILTTKTRTLTRLKRGDLEKDTISEFTSQYSQYSFCSCSQCQKDDGFSSGSFSDFFDSASNMAPNSEETSRKDGHFSLMEEVINKEKQRPPVYNPEDYATMLKKWSKKSTSGGLMSLYSNSSTSDLEISRSQSHSFRDYRNPMLTSSGSEMTLRQFGTVSELLTKLKTDLKLAFPSFVQEFVADPLDGVTLLLDLLRTIQLNQSNTVIHGSAGSSGTTGKIPPSLQRRALLDELSCLQCILNCCVRYTESVRKLISSSAGLFTVAVCIMSNVNKSRIIALQLLARACDPNVGGHSAVSEAMSTLRLRFGEPVRFRFLVGMMTSASGQKELLTSGLKFLNRFTDTAGSTQKKLYVQAELEQAGFDIDIIKKTAGHLTDNDHLQDEIRIWEKKYIDMDNLTFALETYKKENVILQEKVQYLEQKIKELQEEKGALTCVEKSLKDRCSELQLELRSLKSTRSSKTSFAKKRHDLTPNEDEGISSSERSLTPEDGIRKEPVFRSKSCDSKSKDDDEETTIDQVIEELKNIINDAESQDLARREQQRKMENEKRRVEEAQVASKLRIHIDADDYAVPSEHEIVPSGLHPPPPRRAKSLIHLFVPSEDYYYCPKELFFENETPYTSTEGSDSLLSASKCAGQRTDTPETVAMTASHCKKMSDLKKNKRSVLAKTELNKTESLQQLNKTMENRLEGSYLGTTTVSIRQYQVDAAPKTKCKSLERIDNGLDSMVDIIMTDQSVETGAQMRPKEDSSRSTSLVKSVSNVYIRNSTRPRMGSFTEEKSTIFLPPPRDPYYFPRIQDRKMSSSSFLIKRGHGNAGLYSGQVRSDDRCTLTRNKEFLSNTGMVNGKLTDLPSGLY